MKLDHIGLAVKDLKLANEMYCKIFKTEPIHHEEVPSEGVEVSFFNTGETHLELLASTHAQSSIAKFIEKKGEGIHHIAFEVDDILLEMNRLKNEGFRLLNEIPKKGANNKWVCFLQPKDTGSVLIEICQKCK